MCLPALKGVMCVSGYQDVVFRELTCLRRDRDRQGCDRRACYAGSRVDLRLVQAFVNEELGNDRIELLAVLCQQPSRLGVALVGDPPYFFSPSIEETVRDSGH